jgi:hypothetical protein
MSFEDDAVEPLAVESAEHFLKLVRRSAGRAEAGDLTESSEARRERREPRRALPRELGN